MTGSSKNIVIAPEAEATLDIRLLSGQDPAGLLAQITHVIAHTAVQITAPAPVKTRMDDPVDTDLCRAIERATNDRAPNALVTTPMLTAATDRPYRALGIIAYGFDPFRIGSADMQKVMHGNDGRLPVANVGFGARYLTDVLRYAQ